jgi:hypothetical protein
LIEQPASAKKPRKPISDLMRLTAFSIPPGPRWDEECLTATMPPTWLARLRQEYHKRPGIKEDYSLPTRGLVELLIAVGSCGHSRPLESSF